MSFSLPSKVTQANVVALENEGLLNIASLQSIDCSQLVDFDSTVLTVLLAWQKKLQEKDQSIAILQAPEKLKVLANVYGVSALLGLQ
ncbi:lipid asymmetry maintenance protein MlaB [Polynucleobacter paneuropaeus]|uniref:Anti-anti-sigma factor n=1 Tax=Polynucleobacter paneuropaeus TaxID=2527775 RepID=A0A2Z4JQI8_9BURK|nr:STAS domain-containing protein [Polynucleobacter paneuropaeus]AWW48989.1 anti-anti-sigma factor [Polynucleobacter paneuropaeus]